jgi:hypothetical protein
VRPQFESVHLSHFDGPAGEVPPRIAKRFVFYGDLARFASLTESGRARRTPIRCKKRPGRKQCRGLLVVRRRDLPAALEWECPECSAMGHISGWEDTDADLRRFALDPDQETRPVTVSVPAHAALRDVARTDASLIPLAYGAEVDDAGGPILLVAAADSLRYASVVLRHSLVAPSQRACELLCELAEALTTVTADWQRESAFIELDPATSEAVAGVLNELEDSREPEFVPARPRPRPKSTRRRATEPQTFQIKVTLRNVKPPVWRRLIVPSDISLPALHEVVQAAMGWFDCHLHLFRVRDREFSPPGDFEPIGEDSRKVSLDEIAPRKGSRVVYEYDFGDGWCHDIVVEDVIDGRCSSVRCLKGRRRCPPENCGGPWGYAELREAVADPTHERRDELLEWIPEDFDPEEFDVVQTDALVRDVRV